MRIRDQGIGIPADEQAQLFQRFVRASNGPDHGIAGAGLGLFVCRELLERQGGRSGSSQPKAWEPLSSSLCP